MTTESSHAPEITWTWSSPKLGWLATIVHPDGLVKQSRLHSAADTPSDDEMGRLTPQKAKFLQTLALAVLEAPLLTGDAAHDVERVELNVSDASGNRCISVPVVELDRHPAMAKMRKAIVAARTRTGGGFFSWRSPSGRLTYLLAVLMACFAWWIVRDWRTGSRMAQEARRIEGTVITREGKSGTDKDKYITVSFMPQGASTAQEAKIADYLSAENWSAAEPGSKVKLWNLPETNQIYLESDIIRWNSDKKWIVILPLGIAACMAPIIWVLRRHRIGAHGDGQEYLIKGDRVTSDDKGTVINRTQGNFVRLLFRFAGA
ncbi:MAG TPA: hypothetical protein VHM91_22245 [Verrucomicrobiales bacterium]|nr:hypothetical protein [Verrucomicrobiales bacterium]